MSLSIDAEKILLKIQYSFMIFKKLSKLKLEIQGTFLR